MILTEVIKRIFLFPALIFLSILATLFYLSMKYKVIKNLFLYLFIILVISLPLLVSAQIGDPSCDPADPGCPIDGGLSALLILGAGYGIKKVRDARKTNNT